MINIEQYAICFTGSMLRVLTGIILSFMLYGCEAVETKVHEKKLFTLLSEKDTGIDFANMLTYDDEFNIYTYRNFYNGGGVALGDVNNDGLIDIYLSSNQKENKLYLNRGHLRFEDITVKAGVKGGKAWSTGVSMADVNGDGWLDIYVCNSGDVKGDRRENELFINNGDLTFSEKAAEYGVDDSGLSTHAVFFDYDKDGDLDLYLLNNSYRAIGSFNLRINERSKRDSLGGDKLFRNDGNKFIDVSTAAGIYGSVIGFGLGVTIGDVNNDDWQDIYVSNDFFERDYLYLNNHDGTFKECLEEQMGSISSASMGADMADINNDLFPEIFVTDMLPKTEERLKTKTTFENWDHYSYAVENGYYYQFTRNTLQLNNGNGTFSEVARLAGVEATDWSWGALLADLNNDGSKDIFVSNGIYQDLTDQDYLNFIANDETKQAIITRKGVDFKKLIDYIPSSPISNYAFENKGDLHFDDVSKDWGLDMPGFSNGSAYGDLDNDGDLDLVINNVNMPLFVYRNESNVLLKNNHFLKVVLKGKEKNTSAIGAKVIIQHDGKTQFLEQMPMRGFQSSVDPRLNFGLGNFNHIDTLSVRWPSGKSVVMYNVPADQTLTLNEEMDTLPKILQTSSNKKSPLFADVTETYSIDFRHIENAFVDFDRDRLIYHMLSSEGPKMCKGDVNSDGLDDFYIGGAKDSPGALFVQLESGGFKKTNEQLLEKDKISENTDCLFFDADNDNDLDLYVATGGNEFTSASSALIDILYINDGRGVFKKSNQLLPTTAFENTSCVKAGDYDQDGDLDLFVGIRLIPTLYGVPANGYILNNDGKGIFTNVTPSIAPGLINTGMITDACWSDIDSDRDLDIIVIGDCMPVKVFKNENGKFRETTAEAGLAKSSGWWNAMVPGDFENDGDIDFVVTNHGLNSRFRASVDKPVSFYINDFDQNGTAEQLISVYNGDKSYPMALRHDIVTQMPLLKKKYLKFDNYKGQTITDIFTAQQLEKAIRYQVYNLATSIMINDGNGSFSLRPLPTEAQLSPIYGAVVRDFNHDGADDIVLGGNFYRAKPEVGRYDASYGCLLQGDGKGDFTVVSPAVTGLLLRGEVRDMITIKSKSANLLLVGRNNDVIQIYSYK